MLNIEGYAPSISEPQRVVVSSSQEAVQDRAARFIVTNCLRTASASSVKTGTGVDVPIGIKSRVCVFFMRSTSVTLLKRGLTIASAYNSASVYH